jgi:hypothetical protein
LTDSVLLLLYCKAKLCSHMACLILVLKCVSRMLNRFYNLLPGSGYSMYYPDLVATWSLLGRGCNQVTDVGVE